MMVKLLIFEKEAIFKFKMTKSEFPLFCILTNIPAIRYATILLKPDTNNYTGYLNTGDTNYGLVVVLLMCLS